MARHRIVDHQKIAAQVAALLKVRAHRQHQRVPRPERDIPQPAGETLAVAMHTDYRRIESRAELALLDRLANHRRTGQQHHLCQIRPQQAFIKGERPETMESLQQPHAGDIPGKNQPVTRLQLFARRDRGQQTTLPHDLNQKEIAQIP